ncbi:MAG: hypothetical protein LQ342_000515 [Letrouitia transgressa]|nr:MAG: hypothetical protein LQ342_000515 [Letrouitia transgressa]
MSLSRFGNENEVADAYSTTSTTQVVGPKHYHTLSGHQLKARLIRGNEEQLTQSWQRLLESLQGETETIKASGSEIIPEIAFHDLNNVLARTKFGDKLRKRGVALIRGVVSEREALDWKELILRYIRSNSSTKGFPSGNPAVYELYWSPSQVLARAHPNVLEAQRFLMSHWHRGGNDNALISTALPVAYADRLRIRQPGDAGFALGPHVDSGSCERWEENGYGRGAVYNRIFEGHWEDYDPWEMTCRLPVKSDLYNGAGGCSTFRMFQGWLSMSDTSPGEGTLMVNPLLGKATTYFLLRPFFQPKQSLTGSPFLRNDNWTLEDQSTATLQGAVPSNSIHAVDKTHAGNSDSSVLYIPACPLTEANAEYLFCQRDTFAEGTPAPDFPTGEGESKHRGRLTIDYVMENISREAQQAMGLMKYDSELSGLPVRERRTMKRANEILGFAP